MPILRIGKTTINIFTQIISKPLQSKMPILRIENYSWRIFTQFTSRQLQSKMSTLLASRKPQSKNVHTICIWSTTVEKCSRNFIYSVTEYSNWNYPCNSASSPKPQYTKNENVYATQIITNSKKSTEKKNRNNMLHTTRLSSDSYIDSFQVKENVAFVQSSPNKKCNEYIRMKRVHNATVTRYAKFTRIESKKNIRRDSNTTETQKCVELTR